MAILPEDLGRFGYARESGFKGSPGAITVPKNLATADFTPAQARVARDHARNSTKDGYADKPGFKSLTGSVEIYASDQSPSDVGDLIETSLGEEVTASALTFSSASTNVSVTVSAGTIDNIARVSDGAATYHRPGTVSGSTITWAIKPPGGFTPTSIKNASDTTSPVGRAYRDKADGTVDFYQLLWDQAGFTSEQGLKGQGCVPNPFRIIWAQGQLLKFGFSFIGATWTILTTSSGLSDTTDSTATYISDVLSLAIQDLTTPVVLTELTPKSLDMVMGYSMIAGTGGQGISGTTVPASNVTTYIRHNSGEETFKVTLNDNDWDTWNGRRRDETAFQFWTEHMPGTPDDTVHGARMCVWTPRVKVVEVGRTKVDGVWCTALELAIERAANLRRHYISFFGAS
jgi:hypothetical protein